MDPRDFFNVFVSPALKVWRAEPLDIRLATNVLCELDILAEHFLQFTNPNITREQISKDRDALGASYALLAVARDVHDTHKHGRLSRRTALIRSGQRPTMVHKPGYFRPGWYREGWYNTGKTALQVVQDNGVVHDVSDVIEAIVKYWEQELQRAGL
jgi:hypothetical protein